MAKLAQLRWYVRRNARCWEIRKFQCAKPFGGEERGDSTRVLGNLKSLRTLFALAPSEFTGPA